MKHFWYKILILVFIFSACSTVRSKVFWSNCEKNLKFTSYKVNELVLKNGNAFYVTSTNSYSSKIWTYTGSSLILFKITKGQINEVKEFNDIEWDKISVIREDIVNDFNKNTSTNILDGDILGFKILLGEEVWEEVYCIDMQDFIESNFTTPFVKKLKLDIARF